MRFLIDAQLPHGFAARMRDHGLGAHHVRDVGLRESSDREIWNFAARERMTLVSKDEDFVGMSLLSDNGPPLIWIRLGNITNKRLWETVSPLLDFAIQRIRAGERLVEIVDL